MVARDRTDLEFVPCFGTSSKFWSEDYYSRGAILLAVVWRRSSKYILLKNLGYWEIHNLYMPTLTLRNDRENVADQIPVW